jgi:hypothetical protein
MKDTIKSAQEDLNLSSVAENEHGKAGPTDSTVRLTD